MIKKFLLKLNYYKSFLFFCVFFICFCGEFLFFKMDYACAGDGNTKMVSLRGANATINKLKRDRDMLAEKIERVRSINRQYSKKIKELEGTLAKLQDHNIDNYKKTNVLVNNINNLNKKNIKRNKVIDREKKTLELLSKIDAFKEEDEKLKRDAAIAHYNMGNIYFQKGEYEIAYREYYQAVTLMPNDPDAHYNLAFVCGEYLGDYKTALKHYRMYLYLKPNAKDAYIVRGKIREAEVALKSIVDSPLEKGSK